MTAAALLLAIVTAAACSVPGCFLVLRRMSLIGDAISHVILLGIVGTYLIIQDVRSPWLVIGATGTGLLTVGLVELLQRSRLIREDAAIGLVFPALFSIAAILATRYTRNVHLDVDSALLGIFELAAERSWYVGSRDLGPLALWRMGGLLLANVAFAAVFFKELKITTFDPGLAATLGFRPALIHYVLMGLVSLTSVAAFDAVGQIMVVALLIVPAATAYLLVERLAYMLWLSVGLAVAAGLGGCLSANLVGDANVGGAIAAMLGLEFLLALILAPRQGIVARSWQAVRQRRDFERTMLTVHLWNHEGTPSEERESRLSTLPHHLRWPEKLVERTAESAERAGLVHRSGDQLTLTSTGRLLAQRTLGLAEPA